MHGLVRCRNALGHGLVRMARRAVDIQVIAAMPTA